MTKFQAMEIAHCIGQSVADASDTPCAVLVSFRGNACVWDIRTPAGESLACGSFRIDPNAADVDADEVAARERAAAGAVSN